MKFRHLLILLAFQGVSACSVEQLRDTGEGQPGNTTVPESAVPGIIQIKMDKAYEDCPEALDLSALGDFSIRPAIPQGGKFSARHREAGLNLWYTVCFSPELPLTKAGADLGRIPGIDKVSYVLPAKSASACPFNDPDFGLQWDFVNDGTVSGAAAGSDINILPAWEVTRGSENVIVAICDAAIECSHEDLAGNIWTNEAEANGEPGVDDDGNGYVDDIHGWNFVTMDNTNPVGPELVPGDHGTHIAGTIAAVNDNGTGISGIAGGDSPEGNGVRLMSVQTNIDDSYPAFIGEAIIYAADNGAVIMNCSWGIDEDTEFINDAIDYFNTYAGFDEHGSQTGPVAGGLCIFAAGNESSTTSYPAMNDNVVAVASVGADYELAYYSNYGSWVDISAPGGDAGKGFRIYSTLTSGSGSYGYMQGTSMACPHVTGIAALIASRFGGPGFTRDQLKDILLGTANPVIYDYNPAYSGMLGTGLADAGAAVASSPAPPVPVGDDFRAEAVSNSIFLQWTAPEDSEGNVPYAYDIYYSVSSLEDMDPDNLSDRTVHLLFTPGNDSPEMLEYAIRQLDFGTEYFFRIRSRNIFGDFSELSCQTSCTTGQNTPPSVTASEGTSLTLKSHETGVLHFDVNDPDGHDVTCEVLPAEGTASLDGLIATISEEGVLTLTINALKAREGTTYHGTVRADDSYDASELGFSYTVGENHSPEVISQIDDVVFNSRTSGTSFSLSGIFGDADGEDLVYGYSISTTGIIVKGTISGDTFEMKANSYGQTVVTVTATDGRGESVSCSFNVLVRDGSREMDLYPNPVKDILNIRTGETVTADITVSNKAGATVFRRKEADISPFAPVSVDMSGMPGGVYYVSIKGSGIDASYPVAKQ